MSRQRSLFCFVLLGCTALAFATSSSAAAQGAVRRLASIRASCEGDTITAVELRAQTASGEGAAARGWKITSQLTHMRRDGTRPEAIKAYLRLKVGEVCTDLHRSESERLLRAQTFIASAAIVAVSDGPKRVRLVVDTSDEMPLTGGVTFGRGTVSSLQIGTLNWDGAGLEITGSLERGFAYRTGVGLKAVQYALFGKPDFVGVNVERNPHGDRLKLEYGAPFLTDFQRHGKHAAYTSETGYYSVVQPVGDNLSLYVSQQTWDIGTVRRFGRPGQHTVFLAGVALVGYAVRTGPSAVIISDTGIVTSPSPQIDGRYPGQSSVRATLIGGLRSLRFLTVRGFDALRAEQDMGIGVQFNLMAGPDIATTKLTRGLFAAGDLYAGWGDEETFVELRALGEGHVSPSSKTWDGVVAHSSLAWYRKPTEETTQIMSLELSSIHNLPFPGQLSFRSADGGLRGYGGSTVSGAQRAIVRVEQRRLLPWLPKRADLAWALFADGGKLWSDAVPFGQDSPVRGSVGLSLLATVPSGTRRVYRVDLAIPLAKEPGAGKFEVRFSGSDRSRFQWTEPADLTRFRSGAVPTNLVTR